MTRNAPFRIWFNKGLSNVYDAVTLSRAADRATTPGGAFRFLVSHTRVDSPALTAADEPFLEPPGLDEASYLAWALAVCRSRAVDLFVPGSHRRAVARQREAFAAAGTRVLALGASDVLELMNRKDAFYADLADSGLAIPAFRVATTLAEFDAAWAELRPSHERLCIKPTQGVYGAGFYVLHEEEDEYARVLASTPNRLGLAAFRRALAAAPAPRPLMVMEYLPGVERSVDCVAHEGTLVAAVARAKHDGYQVLETAGPAVEMARVVAARYGLSGIFNLQTRDTRGTPHLLEVNSRMSGGVSYACHAGVVLPYWALRLALGLSRPEEVPAPVAGGKVAQVTASVLVGQTVFATPPAESVTPALAAVEEEDATIGAF